MKTILWIIFLSAVIITMVMNIYLIIRTNKSDKNFDKLLADFNDRRQKKGIRIIKSSDVRSALYSYWGVDFDKESFEEYKEVFPEVIEAIYGITICTTVSLRRLPEDDAVRLIIEWLIKTEDNGYKSK